MSKRFRLSVVGLIGFCATLLVALSVGQAASDMARASGSDLTVRARTFLDLSSILSGSTTAIPHGAGALRNSVDFPDFSNTLATPQWTESLAAGCGHGVNFVYSTCTVGSGIEDDIWGAPCHGGGTNCQNPRDTGGLTCVQTTTINCHNSNDLAGTFSGTILIDVHSNSPPYPLLYTASFPWLAILEPNNVASPPPTGVFPGPNRSCEACQSNAGAPVNIVTGELWYRHTDAALSGPFGLSFSRFYTAQTTFSGDLGNNWRHTYDANLDVSQLSSGIVTAYDNENTFQIFVGIATGQSSYDQTSGSTLGLSLDGSTFTLTTFSGVVSKFDSSGRLRSIQDRIGNVQTVTRDSSHNYRMSSVSDALGRSLSFGYDTSNRITSVTSTPSGISMTLTYGSSGCGSNDLCSVTESDGKTWNYQYDTANPAFPHNLTKVTDPNGNTEEVNIFEPSQNVIQEQYTALDSQGHKIGDMTFNYARNSTTINESVNRHTYYVYNDAAQVTQVQGALCQCGGDSNRLYSYDIYGRLLSVIDGDGNKTTFSYGRDAYSQYGVISAAYPGPTQIVEPLTGSTTRTWNMTYYAFSGRTASM